jgi:hypothetical protein
MKRGRSSLVEEVLVVDFLDHVRLLGLHGDAVVEKGRVSA